MKRKRTLGLLALSALLVLTTACGGDDPAEPENSPAPSPALVEETAKPTASPTPTETAKDNEPLETDLPEATEAPTETQELPPPPTTPPASTAQATPTPAPAPTKTPAPTLTETPAPLPNGDANIGSAGGEYDGPTEDKPYSPENVPYTPTADEPPENVPPKGPAETHEERPGYIYVPGFGYVGDGDPNNDGPSLNGENVLDDGKGFWDVINDPNEEFYGY